MRSLTLRARLTMWYTLTLVVVVLALGADVLIEQERLGIRRVDRELQSVSGTVAALFDEELEELGDPVAAAGEARDAVQSLGDGVAILNGGGSPLVAQLGALRLTDIGPTAADGGTTTVETPFGRWRVFARRSEVRGIPVTLVITRRLDELARERREVTEAMLIVIPVGLLLAGLGGWWLASVGLRPVRDMADRAAQIPLTGFDDLGPPSRDDELGQLGRAFNGLVARLRGALDMQRQFMADASHELRTPVSIIRTASQVTLGRERRDEIEYRDTLAIVDSQARQLARLVEDMLVLARADAGAYQLRHVSLYLDDVVEECRRAVALLAAERSVTLRTTGAADVTVRGDEELIRRLVLNLLQNAVQHSPPGGIVTVEIALEGPHVRVRVSDTGPGISEADRSRIFDRFVQLDPSRRADGSGLGLPIAKWIAEAHHGSLALEETGAAGSTFTAVLPVSGV